MMLPINFGVAKIISEADKYIKYNERRINFNKLKAKLDDESIKLQREIYEHNRQSKE